jgi:crotonobetainyl-CoA:carnitine CoA-transferase CaiB-like acyl-CoA transferase
MAALRRRERRGVGELVEFPQAENMMQHLGEYYIDADRTGRVHRSPGNRDPQRAPQGCYLAGDGRYFVLTVDGDEQWRHLAAAVGAGALAELDEAGRRAAHDEIDHYLASWAAGRSAAEAVAECRAHGLSAAPVLGEGDCLADEHLAARGALRTNGSADLGQFLYPEHLFRWDGPPLRWDPVCRMGADNESVYRRWLGCSDAELAAWRDAGQLSEDYLRPDGTPF